MAYSSRISLIVFGAFLIWLQTGCQASPGPDKQFEGSLLGAAQGAGSGAVTGFQVGAGTGPGAAVGAGLGAVAGGLRGLAQDNLEEQLQKIKGETEAERERAWAESVIAENQKRRLEIHPTRDIYPADLFFIGDDVTLSRSGRILLKELSRLNMERLPWSRLVIACYIRANDKESSFGHYLAEKRSIAIGDYLIRAGFGAHRIVARGVVIDAPVLIDPHDAPERYNQAIEIIPEDR